MKSPFSPFSPLAAVVAALAVAGAPVRARADRLQLDGVALASYNNGVFEYDSSNPMLRGSVRAEYVSAVRFDSAMLSRLTFADGRTEKARILSYEGGMFRFERAGGGRGEARRDDLRRVDFNVEKPAEGEGDAAAEGLKVVRGVGVEKLTMFPSEFAGKTVTLENCRVNPIPLKANGQWLLGVASAAGKPVQAAFTEANPVAFRVDAEMARQLVQVAGKSPKLTGCNLVCTLRPCLGTAVHGFVTYIAMVDSIEFPQPGGAGRRALRSAASESLQGRSALTFGIPAWPEVRVSGAFPGFNVPLRGAPVRKGDLVTAVAMDEKSPFKRVKDMQNTAEFRKYAFGRYGVPVRFKIRRQGKGTEEEVVYPRDIVLLTN